MLKFIFILFFCCSMVSTSSCNRSGTGTNTSGKTEQQQRQRTRKPQVNIISPKNNDRYALDTDVILSVKAKDGAAAIDSLRWFVDGRLLTKMTTVEPFTWNTTGHTTGTHRIEAVVHYADGQRDLVSVGILLLAGKAPVQYTYKVMKTYPHDKAAYTQGLLFDEGYLYESTGLQGESTVRKVDLTTGEPLQVTKLPQDMFGEGLALVDDKLIQLTYQSQIAFIYNKADFKLLNRINYPMREGWGLTYDGKHLLMTDGTANLYFLDKEYLTEVKRIEVCDNKGPVYQLNELEYINGELWANVYLTENILRIDPSTGCVIGIINMKGLLNAADQHPDINVLNGIAYDQKTGKIYVTGKNWPKLFEIQVVRK